MVERWRAVRRLRRQEAQGRHGCSSQPPQLRSTGLGGRTMKNIEDADCLVSMRVADMRANPIEGTIQGTCTACNEAVWVSPTSRATLDKMPSLPLMCIQCANEHFEASGDEEIGYLPQEGQDAEFARGLFEN